MGTYITLINWTDQGIRDVKECVQRLADSKKAVVAAGGKMTGFYLTMGRYDMVVISEGRSDAGADAAMLSIARRGSIRSETLKAFPEEQFRDIIAKVQ